MQGGIQIQARKRQVLQKQRTPTRREVGQKKGNRAQGPDRRTLLPAGPDNREPQAGGVPQRGFGSIGEVTWPPALAQRRLGPRERPLGAAFQTGGAALWARGGANARPALLLGDAGMFTLLTAAAAGGGAGVAGGWAAARLALGTRLAVRRVGARACSVRGGGAAGGGDRLPALQPQPPAHWAFPRRRLAEPPARPGSLAGRRTENSQLPGEWLPGSRAPGLGEPGRVELPAGVGRGRGGREGAGRPPGSPRRGGGGAGRVALELGGGFGTVRWHWRERAAGTCCQARALVARGRRGRSGN